MRTATIKRTTKETDIAVSVNLDGTGQTKINTGIGFFDHMLDQLGKHSLIDIEITAKGDLHIDGHHTAEDVGLALGAAMAEAVGDKKGIYRYGHAYVAMDDSLSRAALDFSGRPFLVWDAEFTMDRLGEMDTELFQEFFHAFAQKSKLTLHCTVLYGQNNHHKIESLFKACAKALRMALTIDARAKEAIPSTKGVL
jgi:imidazoleglycerol-phosphate dehydratase